MSGRILIVESIATNRIMLISSLESAHYSVIGCASTAEAKQLLKAHDPDVVFLDMSSDYDDALGFLAKLSKNPGAPPVIATLAYDDSSLRLAALRAGAADVVTKPQSESVMHARVRSLLRARDTLEGLHPVVTCIPEMGFAEPGSRFTPPQRIVVLSSRPNNLMPALAGLITKPPGRYEVHHSTPDFSGAEDEPKPDLFIIDGIGPDGAPKVAGEILRLQADLRSRTYLRHAAQLIILPPDAADLASMALDMGAEDLVSNRVSPLELGHRIEVLLRRKAQSDAVRAKIQSGLEAAVTDPLTGLHNRRYAMPQLARMAELSAHERRPFAIMILDIDHFKAINDTYGHATGDMVLVDVAKRLRAKLRPNDMIARIGGEEFLVAMPSTSLAQARMMAERLRRAVENRGMSVGAAPGSMSELNARTVPVTMSIGVALGGPDCQSEEGLHALFERADTALYQAKADGRNMVTLCPTAA